MVVYHLATFLVVAVLALSSVLPLVICNESTSGPALAGYLDEARHLVRVLKEDLIEDRVLTYMAWRKCTCGPLCVSGPHRIAYQRSILAMNMDVVFVVQSKCSVSGTWSTLP
jgi:hypothetical protein